MQGQESKKIFGTQMFLHLTHHCCAEYIVCTAAYSYPNLRKKRKNLPGVLIVPKERPISPYLEQEIYFFSMKKKKKSQGVSEKWDSIMSPEEQQPWYDLEDEKRNEYIFNMEPGFKKNLAIDRNRKDGHFYLDRKRK